MEMDSMGGSLHTFPAQAIVIRFGFHPSVPPQLTKTAGTGDSTFPGFQDRFSMSSFFAFAMPSYPFETGGRWPRRRLKKEGPTSTLR
jgi:hypothetical protein